MQTWLGITVEEALALPALRNARLVAGRAGAGRAILHVNVMEVPDVLDWVKPGEFLVTTAFSIKDDPAAQAALLPELAKRGLAGLGIKPRRYLPEIPPLMIEQADQLGFPLVEIPPELAFSDLINPIMAEVLHRQGAYLRRAEEVHRELMDAALAGDGIAGLTGSLARLMNNPVALVLRGEPPDFAPGPNAALDGSALLASLDEAADAADVADPAGSHAAPGGTAGGGAPRRWSFPVAAAGKRYGMLHVWEVHRPLTPFDVRALERAATVAALQAVSARAVREVERRYQSAFLDDLLQGNYETEAELLGRARQLGWDLRRPRAVVLAEPAGADDEPRLLDAVLAALAHDPTAIAAAKGRAVVVLLAVGEADAPPERERAERAVAEMGGQLARELRRHLRAPVLVGAGRYHPGLSGIARSFGEARKALAVARDRNADRNAERNADRGGDRGGASGFVAFADLGVYRLLHAVRDAEELRDFYADTIGPLARYDRDRNAQLVRTLRAYFDCGGNLRKLATSLYTHYNTVVYRLRRIEEITGRDLSNPRDRLNLELGLMVARMLGAAEGPVPAGGVAPAEGARPGGGMAGAANL